MNILITAGKTFEKIDDVRGVTNFATGQLGKKIAEQFIQNSQVKKIFFLTSDPNLITPRDGLEVHLVSTAENLERTIKILCQTKQIDVMVHSMAVSDFKVQKILTLPTLAATLTQHKINFTNDFDENLKNLEMLFANTPAVSQQNKIASNTSSPVLFLEKTPKVAPQIKKWKPDLFYVGFKLLAGVSDQELLIVARKTLKQNHYDLIVANDWQRISNTAHEALVVNPNGDYETCHTKTEIAQRIVNQVIKRWEDRVHD